MYKRETYPMEADATLDTFGLLCPMPIVKRAQEMKELKVGEVFGSLGHRSRCLREYACLYRATGNEYLGLDEREGEYRVYVRKLQK